MIPVKIRAKKFTKHVVSRLYSAGYPKLADWIRDIAFTGDEIRRQFNFEVLFRATAAMRTKLKIDEDSFVRVDGPSHPHPRDYYFYGILDEISKAGTAALQWEELIEGPEPGPKSDATERMIERVLLERVRTEQLLWIRKLTEHLVNVICLTQDNNESSYRAALAGNNLDDHMSTDGDNKEFFECVNENNAVGVDLYTKMLLGIQQAQQRKVLPLFEGPINPSKPPSPGRVFSSIRKRFKDAVKFASANEKVVLRMSYANGFSEASRPIHAIIRDRPFRAGPSKEITGRFSEIGLLAAHLLNRMYSACGISPVGFSKQLLAALDNPQSPTPGIIAKMTQRFSAGDIVLVMGDLAEVVTTNVSDYGYTSARIRYLTKPPIASILEDEWPSRYVDLLVRAGSAREFMRKQAAAFPPDLRSTVMKALEDANDANLHESMKQALLEMHRTGFIGSMLKATKKDRKSQSNHPARAGGGQEES